jgi:hypothetical protein
VVIRPALSYYNGTNQQEPFQALGFGSLQPG